MNNLGVPNKSLTWTNKIGISENMDERASILLELYVNDTLVRRQWNKDGGVHGDDNHTGNGIVVNVDDIIEFRIYNLSLNRLPMQIIVMNGDTTNTNNINSFPTGMVDGNGSVDGSSVKLHKTLIGGQKTIMRFKASSVANSWWKINCNCVFLESNGNMTPVNPNNGIDYGADFFQLDYSGGNIRWNNPTISAGNQIVLPNTATWATANGQETNYWYNSGSNACASPTALSISPTGTLNKLVGESITLTASATGTALRYQWIKDGFFEIPNATNATLTVSNLTTTNAGTYKCRIYNDCGGGVVSPTAETAEVTVNVTSSLDCSAVINKKLFSTWNNASDGSNGVFANQPLESWDLEGNTGYHLLKILKRDTDLTPLWFEARGRNLFMQFPLASGITNAMVDCLVGQDVGMAFDTTYATPVGYTKDGNIYKKISVKAGKPIPNATTGTVGVLFSGVAPEAGTIEIFNSSNQLVATVQTGTSSPFAWSYTPTVAGTYYATLGVSGKTVSDHSVNWTVNATTGGTTKNVRIPAKIDGTGCTNEILQFGYSNAQSTQPTNWVDRDGTVQLISTGGVTSEVTSGGVQYQYKQFALTAGTYHCFARQKTATSNVFYIGSITVTV